MGHLKGKHLSWFITFFFFLLTKLLKIMVEIYTKNMLTKIRLKTKWTNTSIWCFDCLSCVFEGCVSCVAEIIVQFFKFHIHSVLVLHLQRHHYPIKHQILTKQFFCCQVKTSCFCSQLCCIRLYLKKIVVNSWWNM